MTSEQKAKRMYKQFGMITDGRRCKDCDNLIKVEHGNHRVYKCLVYGNTHSESSDWRISNTACGMINREYKGRPIIELRETQSRSDEQIEGQLTVFI